MGRENRGNTRTGEALEGPPLFSLPSNGKSDRMEGAGLTKKVQVDFSFIAIYNQIENEKKGGRS